jgi:hypothetical protein
VTRTQRDTSAENAAIASGRRPEATLKETAEVFLEKSTFGEKSDSWPVHGSCAPQEKTRCPLSVVTLDGTQHWITNNVVWYQGPDGGKEKPMKWRVGESEVAFSFRLAGALSGQPAASSAAASVGLAAEVSSLGCSFGATSEASSSQPAPSKTDRSSAEEGLASALSPLQQPRRSSLDDIQPARSLDDICSGASGSATPTSGAASGAERSAVEAGETHLNAGALRSSGRATASIDRYFRNRDILP